MQLNHIHTGDARYILPTLPAESVHCCVTSPPYYGLRDYGHTGQIGLEHNPQAYIDNLVAIFRHIHRILRPDGTLWLNLGDSYAGFKDCKSTAQTIAKGKGNENAHVLAKGNSTTRNTKTMKEFGLKNKDLIGIPWRVALALQADGWYLRQDIIWHKPNPMPESVTDRCTKAHEYIFLLSKSPRYYYNADAIREPYAPKTYTAHGCSWGNAEKLGDGTGLIAAQNWAASMKERKPHSSGMANKRSVWTISSLPYPEAHFATYPLLLPRLCIAAGSPERGIILDPFFGSGTTGQAALQLNRQYIGIELNPDYTLLAQRRLAPHQNQPQLQF